MPEKKGDTLASSRRNAQDVYANELCSNFMDHYRCQVLGPYLYTYLKAQEKLNNIGEMYV